MRQQFELFMDAATRAMVRIEQEFIIDSSRFEQPSSCFALFEEEEIAIAKDRFQLTKTGTGPAANWSKVIPGMSR